MEVMEHTLTRFKGIHPGAILDRELRKRAIRPSLFAKTIQSHKQTFNALLKGKRGISIPLSLKVDRQLGLPEGTFAMLQTFYEIEQAKKSQANRTPDLRLLRKVLFWDTNIETIDWDKQATAVIQRVFERGNTEEKNEILRFYGKDQVTAAMEKMQTLPMRPVTQK